MKAINVDALKEACKRLRSADPEVWDIFMQAFEQYANDVTATVIAATPENIFQLQGRAQQCAVLMKLFLEATSTK